MRFELSYDDGLDFQEFIVAFDEESEVACFLSNQDEDDLWMIIVSDDEDDDRAYMSAEEWMAEREQLPAWCKRFDNRTVTPPSERIGFMALSKRGGMIPEMLIQLGHLIEEAFGGSDKMMPDNWHFHAVAKAKAAINSYPQNRLALNEALKSLRVSLTVERVAKSSGCRPLYTVQIAPNRFKVTMECYDEQALYDAVFCVKKVDHGTYGYKATGLWKENGQPVAIIEKLKA